jgi:microcystin-dependent protein
MITNLIDKQSYAGNGSNQNFAVPFTVVVSDVNEIGVILRDITNPLAPVDTPQTYNSQFTLSGANPPGTPFATTVVMNTAPTSNQIVIVYRKMPFSQLLNMVTNNFDFANLNQVHDRIVAMIQVLNEIVNRAPQLPQATQVTQPNIVPEPPGGSVLGFNLGAWVWYSVTAVTNAIATLTGDVTSSGGVNATTVIAANAVTNSKLAQMTANTIKGNNTGSTANAADLTAAQVAALIQSSMAVGIVGEVKMMGTGTVPTGTLECNGQAVSRTTYSRLFGVIGSNYGIGDGSTTFNLPPSGVFYRSWDHGVGNDPDSSTRTALHSGPTGDAVGSYQADIVGPHEHHLGWQSNISVSGSGGNQLINWYTGSSNVVTDAEGTTGTTTGDQTTPRNVNVMMVIVY